MSIEQNIQEGKHGPIIAIDGPVAAGKGTIAPKIAHRLGGFYLPTGAMYRGVALACIENNIDYTDGEKVAKLLPQIKLSFNGERLQLNGTDVADRIRKEDVSKGSSAVAVFPSVREALVEQQQQIGHEKSREGKVVVAEGRDTGTKVFPDADLKVFLTAKLEIRTQRRLKQIEESGQDVPEFTMLLKDIEARDKQDSERETDPLPTDPEKLGYFVVDDSELTEDETIEKIIFQLKKLGLTQ